MNKKEETNYLKTRKLSTYRLTPKKLMTSIQEDTRSTLKEQTAKQTPNKLMAK